MKTGNPDRPQLKNLFSLLSVRTKLIIMLLVVSFCSIIVTSYTSTIAAEQIISEKIYSELTAVRGTVYEQLDQYFKLVSNQVQVFSDSYMFIDAMNEFKQSFDKLATVNIPKEYDDKIEQFYKKEYLPILSKKINASPIIETFLPKTNAARYIQYHYIANNPYPLGEKYKLDYPKDGSDYTRVMSKYNSKIREMAQRFGYHDILLIDMRGNIVYSLADGVDRGTNILFGPASESNLMELFRACVRNNSEEYIKLVDFQPYIMSFNEPVAFVGATLSDGHKIIGVLVFRLPTDEIDNIANRHNKWEENGLGKTGEIYIIGKDLLFRSDSRFLIQNEDDFLNSLRQHGVDASTLKKIQDYHTTILILKTSNQGVTEAFQGKPLLRRGKDFRGIETLGAYIPINFNDLQWAIAVQIDTYEVFSDISKFKNNVMILAAIIMVIISIIAMWMAQIFVAPIERLIATAYKVQTGDEDSMVMSGTRDEYHELAREFNKTVYGFRSEIREYKKRILKSEDLISKIIPLHIANRIEAGEGVIAEPISNVTVLFTDLYRFTRLSKVMSSEKIVYFLDELVDIFDDLIDKYGLEKIKTIGDGYMAVGGLSIPLLDGDKRAIDCGMEMIAQVRRVSYERGFNLDLRIGINTGDLVAGAVGKSRFTYDIWGDTVNTAYRLKESAPPGGILVSANIHERLIDVYDFRPFRPIAEPDKEALEAWLLVKDFS